MKAFFLRHTRVLIIIGVAIVLGAFTPQVLDNTKTVVIEGEKVPVLWIYDGDTIRVRIGGELENVRLLGIDTPEVDTPYTTEECFGPEASEYTKTLLVGKEVVLQVDEESEDRDKFDRLLRYVYLTDGTFINAQLIDEGYARAYRHAEYSYREDFLEREVEAQKEGVGLWSAC